MSSPGCLTWPHRRCRTHFPGTGNLRTSARPPDHGLRPMLTEALHEAVLHGLGRRDVMLIDLSVLPSRQDRVRGQLRAVDGDHHAGIAPHLCDLVEFPRHTMARDRCVDDDAQHPETATPNEMAQDTADLLAPGFRSSFQASRARSRRPSSTPPATSSDDCSHPRVAYAALPR